MWPLLVCTGPPMGISEAGTDTLQLKNTRIIARNHSAELGLLYPSEDRPCETPWGQLGLVSRLVPVAVAVQDQRLGPLLGEGTCRDLSRSSLAASVNDVSTYATLRYATLRYATLRDATLRYELIISYHMFRHLIT